MGKWTPEAMGPSCEKTREWIVLSELGLQSEMSIHPCPLSFSGSASASWECFPDGHPVPFTVTKSTRSFYNLGILTLVINVRRLDVPPVGC